MNTRSILTTGALVGALVIPAGAAMAKGGDASRVRAAGTCTPTTIADPGTATCAITLGTVTANAAVTLDAGVLSFVATAPDFTCSASKASSEVGELEADAKCTNAAGQRLEIEVEVDHGTTLKAKGELRAR